MINVKWDQFEKSYTFLMRGRDDSAILSGMHIVTNGESYIHIDDNGDTCSKLFKFKNDDPTVYSASDFTVVGVRDLWNKTIPISFGSEVKAVLDKASGKTKTIEEKVIELVKEFNGVWPQGIHSINGRVDNALYSFPVGASYGVVEKMNGITRAEFETAVYQIDRDSFTKEFTAKYGYMGLSAEQIGMMYDEGFDLPEKE